MEKLPAAALSDGDQPGESVNRRARSFPFPGYREDIPRCQPLQDPVGARLGNSRFRNEIVTLENRA